MGRQVHELSKYWLGRKNKTIERYSYVFFSSKFNINILLSNPKRRHNMPTRGWHRHATITTRAVYVLFIYLSGCATSVFPTRVSRIISLQLYGPISTIGNHPTRKPKSTAISHPVLRNRLNVWFFFPRTQSSSRTTVISGCRRRHPIHTIAYCYRIYCNSRMCYVKRRKTHALNTLTARARVHAVAEK